MNKAEAMMLLAIHAIRSAKKENADTPNPLSRKLTVENVLAYLMNCGSAGTDLTEAVRTYLSNPQMFKYEADMVRSELARKEKMARLNEIKAAWAQDL